MGTVANTNPWGPYESYRDCSQGICNMYCPQWCYVIFPPPPPSFFLDDDTDDSSSDFSPLLIALIGVLAIAFILLSYYTLINKFCRRRHRNGPSSRDRNISSAAADNDEHGHGAPEAAGDGIDETLIKSIKVYKYRKSDGFVDSSDCSVCLSEFQENESLRLLPKCNHAFHVPCIDTWLKSHSNCPLCRANLTAVNATTTAAGVAISNLPIPTESINRGGGSNDISSSSTINSNHPSTDSAVFSEDLDPGARNVTVFNSDNVRSPPKPSEREPREGVRTGGEAETQHIRRSESLNSGGVLLIADILREIEDEEDDEEAGGVGTSRRREEEDEEEDGAGKAATQRNGGSNLLLRGSMTMKRSVSPGRFILTRYDRARNYRLPN